VSSPPAWLETALLDASEWAPAEGIAGPERSSLLSAAEGEADDVAIRAAGEFCRPVGWLTTGFAAARVANDQGECREIRPAPLLRKAFRVEGAVARARLYASGLAYAHLTMNGARVGESVLDPAFTDYSRTVLYATHDVTPLVRSGENVVAAELGSGQFDNATRTWDWCWDRAQWRSTPRLILQLHLTYEDGTESTVVSDGSWRVNVDGPRRYDSYYLGETYDARREIPGWDRPAFDDSAWLPARVVTAPAGTLRAQAQEPIAVVAERPVAATSEPTPGVFVHDAGQNLTGWAVVRVEAPAGTALELFWESYRRHGDREALERTYPLMRRYLDGWVPRWTARDGDGFAHTLTAGLGDWVPPRSRRRRKSCRWLSRWSQRPGGRRWPPGWRRTSSAPAAATSSWA